MSDTYLPFVTKGDDMKVKGIDRSYANTPQDLRQAKEAGYEFCYIRASQGRIADNLLVPHFEKVMEANMIPGFYHYFRNNHKHQNPLNRGAPFTGSDQAKFFLDLISPLGEQAHWRVLPHMIDVEEYYNSKSVSPYINADWIYNWLSKVIASNISVGMYSRRDIWTKMTANPEWASEFIGWVAQWNNLKKLTLIPQHWDDVRFHQYGVMGRHDWVEDIPGIQGECDVNYFLGSYTVMMILADGSEQPEPEPTPEPELDDFFHIEMEHHVTGAKYMGLLERVNK
jgi:GH25 family lysozyme M1 (1,4-beta-N-acetylmuramidase)